MLRILFSFTPFMVCLFWLIVFALKYRKHNPAKKVFSWFLLTCTVLNFCHALFFTVGTSRSVECIWALCSLSVYPIYYLYIRALTANIHRDRRQYLVLLPGFVVFLILVFWPGKAADYSRMILFTFQIVIVCLSGIRMLHKFDRLVESSYADIEGRKMTDVRILLLAFVLTSVVSAFANFLGRSFFAGDDKLLLLVATIFAIMLFALSYIGYTKEFSIEDLSDETGKDDGKEEIKTSEEEFGGLLEALIIEEKLYLVNGLKITDVAFRMGTCRTYVSNFINQTKGESFSDYINRLRIEDAKKILASRFEVKNISLAAQLGFANEQSFYRNFKKFTGMTPVQWKNNANK